MNLAQKKLFLKKEKYITKNIKSHSYLLEWCSKFELVRLRIAFSCLLKSTRLNYGKLNNLQTFNHKGSNRQSITVEIIPIKEILEKEES